MSKKMNVGLLRQWLNEDRIDDPDKMVTNEMLERWLFSHRLVDESECEDNPVANESYANENTESKKIEKPPILDHSMTDFYDVLDNRELMIKIINHLNKDL